MEQNKEYIEERVMTKAKSVRLEASARGRYKDVYIPSLVVPEPHA